jgi:hypothetical protein
MKCPICDLPMAMGAERKGRNWFVGTYCCMRHGVLRAAGRITESGGREIRSWSPRCFEHGFKPVIRTGENRFRCTACETEILLVHGEFRRLKPVQLITGRRAFAIL